MFRATAPNDQEFGPQAASCLVVVASIFALLGCAAAPIYSPVNSMSALPSEETRTQLGTIGVVSARFTPEHEFHTALRGRVASGAKGAGAGALYGLGEALSQRDPLSAAVALVVLVPLGVILGGTAGAVAAVPEATAQEIEAYIVNALLVPNMQEVVRDHAVETVRNETGRPVVALADQGPAATDEEASYGHLSDQGINTVLEVSVRVVGLVGGHGSDPLLALVLNVRGRLVRTSDDAELYLHTVSYLSAPRKFTEWGEDEGRPVREELDRAYRYIAATIVEEAFLLWRPVAEEAAQ